ncbi:MAG: ZIP family metal transporter [Anaerolineae bacterium]
MSFSNLLFFASLASLAFVAGGALPLYRSAWGRHALHRLMAFGAGVLLGAAFLHLIPEAVEMGGGLTSWGLMSAFFIIFTVEQASLTHYLPEHHADPCSDDPEVDRPIRAVGMVTFFAMAIHGLIDGLILTTAFDVSLSLGLVAAFAIIVHKLPAGLSLSSVLLSSEYPRYRILLLSTLVALATLVGAMAAYLWLMGVPEPLLALLLGFSAGSFIYVGAVEILSRLHEERDLLLLAFFALGLASMILSSLYEIG